MVQKTMIAGETYHEPISINNDELEDKFGKFTNTPNKMFNRLFKTDKKITTSLSLNCLLESQLEENQAKEFTENTNDAINSNLIRGIYNRRCKSLNEIYFLRKSMEDGKKVEIELLNQKKAVSASKIEKCVRFNDDITVQELNDEYDRRPMPLAKMYYKDQVELNQLREEMKQIQYRIINKIDGKVLLGN